MFKIVSVFVLVLAGFMVGCAREEVPVPEDVVEQEELQLDQMQSHVRTMVEDSGLEPALLFGVLALADWEQIPMQVEAVEWLVELSMDSDDPAVHQALVKELITVHEQLGGQAVLMLHDHMMELDAAGWMTFLQDEQMPPAFRVHGYGLWFRYESDDASIEDIAAVLLELKDPALTGFVESTFEFALQEIVAGLEGEAFSWFVEKMRAELTPDSALYQAALHVEGQAYLDQGDLDRAFAHYQEYVDVLDQARLATSVIRMLRSAGETENHSLIEAVREWGYAQDALGTLRNRLARWDLAQLREEESVPVIIDRVRDVWERGIPVSVVARGMLQGILHPALIRADEAERKELRDLLAAFLQADAELDASLQSSLEMAMLDVLFYLEDFAGALERLEVGITGFDEDWHNELLNKVRAHLAEQEGRIADAVGYYEKHIARVAAWTENFVSPEDGRSIQPDEVIALNERRIGDLWMAEGETEKAMASYARAIKHYERARDAYADDAQGLAIVESALQELESVAR